MTLAENREWELADDVRKEWQENRVFADQYAAFRSRVGSEVGRHVPHPNSREAVAARVGMKAFGKGRDGRGPASGSGHGKRRKRSPSRG